MASRASSPLQVPQQCVHISLTLPEVPIYFLYWCNLQSQEQELTISESSRTAGLLLQADGKAGLLNACLVHPHLTCRTSSCNVNVHGCQWKVVLHGNRRVLQSCSKAVLKAAGKQSAEKVNSLTGRPLRGSMQASTLARSKQVRR